MIHGIPIETVILMLGLLGVPAIIIAVSIRHNKAAPKGEDECRSKVASEELPRIKLNGQIGVQPIKEQANGRALIRKEDSRDG